MQRLLTPRAVGVMMVLNGLLFNRWSIQALFASDGHVNDPRFPGMVMALQAAAILGGLVVVRRSRTIPDGRSLVSPLATVLAIAALVGGFGCLRASLAAVEAAEIRRDWERVNASEDLLLALTPRLKDLERGLFNLALPDDRARSLFADPVEVHEVGTGLESPDAGALAGLGFRRVSYARGSSHRSVARSKLDIWRDHFAEVDYFETTRFYIVAGELDRDGRTFVADTGFAATARLRSGARALMRAHLELTWTREGDHDDPRSWRISRWVCRDFESIEREDLIFADVLDEALPSRELLREARRSRHEEQIIEFFDDPEGFIAANPQFSMTSDDRHPAISIVDIDRDGFDDIYFMPEIGRNLLFRNQGDGTFTEAAAEYGLDIEDHCSCALFIDLDNDGDDDLFLCRTLERSMILLQENGRFVDRSATSCADPLPYLATSASAADYDGDGLLDIHVSTYAAQSLAQALYDRKLSRYLKRYLRPADATELHGLITSREADRITSFPGPPNLLLHNLGDARFEVARGTGIELFRNSFQAVWSDHDDDGDPDLYIANDFSTNNLLRNEGDGRFVDVTDVTGTADVGFGMGVSWGDMDGDGRQDLYVSNMYSKAGRRITRQFDHIDTKLATMARGNSLFRNLPGGFEKVSGTEAGTLQVEAAGWSWGSQFLDFDNDGDLDIYALSGYYSAPPQIAAAVDL